MAGCTWEATSTGCDAARVLALLTTLVGLLAVLAGIGCGATAYSRTHAEHANVPLCGLRCTVPGRPSAAFGSATCSAVPLLRVGALRYRRPVGRCVRSDGARDNDQYARVSGELP